jgi:hypothetical protein
VYDNHSAAGIAVCPTCLNRIPYVLPVEPLYDLRLAAQLIPMSHDALRQYLISHKEEFSRRYRRDRQRRLHRMLSGSEIRLIRSRILRFKNPDRTRRAMAEDGS